MSAAKYTPGPWRLDPECLFDDGINATVEGADGIGILDIYPTKFNSSSGRWCKEQEANARLIAAAPEMLDALKRADEALENAYGIVGPETPSLAVSCDMAAVKIAIAKAEGRA